MRGLGQEGRLYRYNLQFFAKDGPGGEKTEDATPKKLSDARKEGQVAKSTELVNALSLFSVFLILKLFGGFIGTELVECFSLFYNMIPEVASTTFTWFEARMLGQEILLQIMRIALPILLCGFVVGLFGNSMQFKWKVTGKPLHPKLSKVNPISGFKRMFSVDKLIELLKSILKIGAIALVVYNVVKDKWRMVMTFYDMGFYQALSHIFEIVTNTGLEISVLFLGIGIFDFYYQKFKFKKDMKMTKQEVKDEYKNSEGDPQVKGKIRQKMRESSRRRMMQELPTADVVITNPTHFAVAIRYDRGRAEAPEVIAKGADYLAQTIKEVAKDNDIMIVENKPLARMLYFNVEIGEQVPPELYQMVADVLVYVYKAKNKVLA